MIWVVSGFSLLHNVFLLLFYMLLIFCTDFSFLFVVLNEVNPEFIQMTIDQSLLSQTLLSLPKSKKRKAKAKISDNSTSVGGSASPRAFKCTSTQETLNTVVEVDDSMEAESERHVALLTDSF